MGSNLEEKVWNYLKEGSRTYTAECVRSTLENVGEVPEEYQNIGEKCFYRNGKVHGVKLPKQCCVIGRSAFEGCMFQKEVVFPGTLTYIGERAFAENHRLKRTHLPVSLRHIGKECYKECSNLISAEFHPRSPLLVLSEGIFDSCSRLNCVSLPIRTKVIGRRAFYRCKDLTRIILPEGLTSIGTEAFYFCRLEKIDLPEGVVKIGESAFFRCKELQEIKIPKTVRYIGKWAFHGCSRLKMIEILHEPEYIGDWIINKSCKVRCYPGSVVDTYCEKYGFEREYVTEPEKEES